MEIFKDFNMTITVKTTLELLDALTAIDDNLIIIESGQYYFNNSVKITNKAQILGIGNVILDFRNTPYKENGIEVYADGITLSNITIQYAGWKGLYINSSCSTYYNIISKYNCDSGILVKHGGNNKLINCESSYNFDYNLYKNDKPKFGFSSDGFSDKQYSGMPNTYINCVAHHNGDDGFDFYQRETQACTLLINCKAYNNGILEFDGNLSLRFDIKKQVYNSYNPNGGNGFKLGGGHDSEIPHNILLQNCSGYDNNQFDINYNRNRGEMHLYNCTGNKTMIMQNYYKLDICH